MKSYQLNKMCMWAKDVILSCLLMLLPVTANAQKQWTLDDCISYAMQNNITLKQARLTKQTATEERK